MITAYGDVPTAVLAMKAGAFHFVQKPFDAEALLTTVEEALSRGDETDEAPLEMKGFKARQALLTQREREVLALLLEGLPTKVIAHHLHISSRTAEHHGCRYLKDASAQHFPSHAHGVHCEKSQRGRAGFELERERSTMRKARVGDFLDMTWGYRTSASRTNSAPRAAPCAPR